MPSIRFRTKTNGKVNSIYLRFKQGNLFDVEVSTGIKVPKGKFSISLQRINYTEQVDYKKLNNKLRILKNFVHNQYSIDSIEGLIINNKWLKDKINNYLNIKTKDNKLNEKAFLTAFMQTFIDDAKGRLNNGNNPIKQRTIQHYETTKNKIEIFEKYKGTIIRLPDLSLMFHHNFIEYLTNEELLNPNTIGGYIDVIKQVCKKAELKGYKVNRDYKNSMFYSPSNKTLDTYLTIEEIHKINDHKLKYDYLDNARDWLIISVWTGLRISDLMTLNESNIEDNFIKKDTLKTKFPVIIPIHNQVKSILNKRNGSFPRKISDQNYNRYIKLVCKEVGIVEEINGFKSSPIEVGNGLQKKRIYRKKEGIYPKFELISSHVGRRSFASNHYGNLDTLTLMKITGHQTEKQFLDYIKITPIEYAKKLKIYWEEIDFHKFINS